MALRKSHAKSRERMIQAEDKSPGADARLMYSKVRGSIIGEIRQRGQRGERPDLIYVFKRWPCLPRKEMGHYSNFQGENGGRDQRDYREKGIYFRLLKVEL